MVTESTAPTDLSHYVWRFPGCPVKVYLALEVVRRLGEQIQLAGPGATGEGLLLGKRVDGATEVLDFQPAAGRVPEIVASLPEGEGRSQLVGYYRIEPGEGLRLNQSDLSLAAECFDKPYQVFLIIQPSAFGPPNASFFFHDHDGKMAEFSFMEFPFEPLLLAGEERDRLRRSQDAAARRAAALEPVNTVPALSTVAAPRRGQGGYRRIAVGVLFALLISVAGISANSRPFQAWWSQIRVARAEPVVAPPPASALSALAMGLHAKRENGDVAVTWNRESPVIVGATSGVLSIQDGPIKREIVLDATQIRSSSVIYTPKGDHVSVNLAITTPISTVIESIVMLLPGVAPPKPVAAPIQSPVHSPIQSPIQPQLQANAEPSPVTSIRPFTPPSISAEPAKQDMPPLPLLQAGVRSVKLPDWIPSMTVLPTMFSAPPPRAVPQPVTYHPAEPVRKVVPKVPPQFLATLAKPATVEVRVTIDEIGRVTNSKVVPRPGLNAVLLKELNSVARSWTFTPARRGDQAISSEFLLQFKFSK